MRTDQIYMPALIIAAVFMTTVGCTTAQPQQEEEAVSDERDKKAVGGLGYASPGSPQIEPTMDAVERAVQVRLGSEPAQCQQMEEEQDWSGAAACYVRAYKETENEVQAEAIALKASANFERAGDAPKAQMTRVIFLRDHPNSTFAAAVLVVTADAYAAHGAPAKAARLYEGYIRSFPDGHLTEYVESKCEALSDCRANADDAQQ